MNRSKTINCGGCLIDISSPIVMGIINNTPDSFYEGSRTVDEERISERIRQMVADGAAIIDIGGYSSRPGAEDVSEQEESRRVMDVMAVVRRIFPDMPVSVDTFRAGVIDRVVDRFGAVIINDITSSIYDVAGKYGLPYIAMHMQGTPQTMASETHYNNMIEDILAFFAEKIARCREAGVKDLIVDPGFGFGKTLEQNFELLRQMNTLGILGLPILAGVSRKSMIYRTLDITPNEALNGTTALHWEALSQGADILRVHDVKEAAQTVALYRKFKA